MRWRWPAAELVRIPRRVCGVEADELKELGDALRRATRLPARWMISGSSTIAPARIRGLSDEYGS
jgi:hypothetical protein